VLTVQFTGLVSATDAEWAAARLKLTWVYFITGGTEAIRLDNDTGLTLFGYTSSPPSDDGTITLSEYTQRAATFNNGTADFGTLYGYSGLTDYVVLRSMGTGSNYVALDAFGGTDKWSRITVNASATAARDIKFYVDGDQVSKINVSGLFVDQGAWISGGATVGSQSGSPADGTLILDQGTLDGVILECQSDDMDDSNQGMETSHTYFQIKKVSGDSGGAALRGASESNYGLWLRGSANTADATETTSSRAPVILRGMIDDSGVGSGNNVIAFQDNTTTRFVMKDTGEFYNDYSTAMTAFPDTENDMALISTIADTLSGDILRSEWDDFVTYNANDLARLDIVTKTGFVNQQNITKLFIGAFRQEHAARQEMAAGFERRISELEAK